MLKNKTIQFIFQILPFLVIILSAAIFFFSQEKLTIDTLLLYTPSNYFLAILYLLSLYTVKSFSVFFPISILMVLSGIIFPLFQAILLNLTGTLICIMIGYWIGYSSVSIYADKMSNKFPRLKEFVEKQRKNEWFVSYFLRVCPISCDVVSIYLGSIKISLRKYFITGIIGSLPGIVSATLLGVSLEDPFSPMCIFAFSMVIVLSAVSYIIYKCVQKRK